jgi:hypothetical protein
MSPPDFRVHGLDHVQLAMPAGEEALAREFYSGVLGLTEVPKPANLAKRGERGSRAAPCGFISASRLTSAPPRRLIPPFSSSTSPQSFSISSMQALPSLPTSRLRGIVASTFSTRSATVSSYSNQSLHEHFLPVARKP